MGGVKEGVLQTFKKKTRSITLGVVFCVAAGRKNTVLEVMNGEGI